MSVLVAGHDELTVAKPKEAIDCKAVVAEARELEEPPEQPRKLGVQTIVFLLLTAAALVAGVYFVSIGAQPAGPVALVVAVILGIPALVGIARDLSRRIRVNDAGTTLRAYYDACNQDQWKRAHAYLAHLDRTKPHRSPGLRFSLTTIEPREGSFDTWEGLRDYWKHLAAKTDFSKFTGSIRFEPEVGIVRGVQRGAALAKVTFKIVEYAGRQRTGEARFDFDVPLYERDGCWYVLDGGIVWDRRYVRPFKATATPDANPGEEEQAAGEQEGAGEQETQASSPDATAGEEERQGDVTAS